MCIAKRVAGHGVNSNNQKGAVAEMQWLLLHIACKYGKL